MRTHTRQTQIAPSWVSQLITRQSSHGLINHSGAYAVHTRQYHITNLFSTRTVSTQKVLAHLCIFSHTDMHIGTVVLGAYTTQKERAHWHLRWWRSRSELALVQLKIKWKWEEGSLYKLLPIEKSFQFCISFFAGASEPYNKLPYIFVTIHNCQIGWVSNILLTVAIYRQHSCRAVCWCNTWQLCLTKPNLAN